MTLDKNSHQPLYRQLMEELKNMIQSEQYINGQKIPTEPELAQQYDVSRITVRRTIEELCKQGYLVKHQGKGTFVEAPKIHRKIEQQSSMSFTESCKSESRKAGSHVISCNISEPEAWQNDFLHLKQGDNLIHIQRVLSADDIPVIFENIYLPVSRFADFQAIKLENGSLFQILKEEYQVTNSKNSRSTIEIAAAEQNAAEYLGVLAGEPVMIMSNYMRDDRDEPVYISYEIIVGSRYMLTI